MAEKRKSCRERTLDLMASVGDPNRIDQFPNFIDQPQPHKLGHAKQIPTPTGSLVKVRCKCDVPHWISITSLQKKGRKPGRFCFICGAKREVVDEL